MARRAENVLSARTAGLPSNFDVLLPPTQLWTVGAQSDGTDGEGETGAADDVQGSQDQESGQKPPAERRKGRQKKYPYGVSALVA